MGCKLFIPGLALYQSCVCCCYGSVMAEKIIDKTFEMFGKGSECSFKIFLPYSPTHLICMPDNVSHLDYLSAHD